jgi:tRNA U34 5-methylaminomethyl-2-thiouridine-forming methyltransferase MnmC
MTDATRKPTEPKPSRGSAAAAVQEIFDYIEDFFVFCDAFAPQLTPLQLLVYQRFQETAKSFRHDMRIATYGPSRIGRPSL